VKMKRKLFRLRPEVVLIASVILVFGIYQAISIKWVCDDIFITFRYIQNWLNGLGLVYNAGERVEGYTHFLWLCIIALFQKTGISPVASSEWMGIFSYAVLLLIFLIISYRLKEEREFYFPFAAAILALHYDLRIWVTSGLETSFFTMLIALAFFVLCYLHTSESKRLLITGFLLTLALLTRPDAVIFYAITFLYIIVREISGTKQIRHIIHSVLTFILPLVLIYIPYLVWKIYYYGDIFPNTYYAKSGGTDYYSRGFFYIYTYFYFYLSSLFFLCGFVFLLLKLRKSQGTAFTRIRELFTSSKSAPVILALAFITGYGIFFIARVGGDFMYARFIIPIIPFFYFAAEASLRELFAKWKNLLPVIFALIILLLLVDESRRDIPYIEGTATGQKQIVLSGELKMGWNGIIDEHWFYTKTNQVTGLDIVHSAEQLGYGFRNYFDGKKVRVLIMGAQACLAYYAGFDYCIENFGLTDKYIAHLPLKERGRPGHERNAPNDYLVAQKIDFVLGSFPQEYSGFQYIEFKMPSRFYQGTIITYNKELMKHLLAKYPGQISFIDFEKYLDDYIKDIKSKPAGQVKMDYKKFNDYYFSRNNDPAREKYFIDILNKQQPDF
jgi:hypothetical protein